MNKRHARLRHRLSVLSGSVDRRQKVALVIARPCSRRSWARASRSARTRWPITKVIRVMDFARQHRHPLQCSLEKD